MDALANAAVTSAPIDHQHRRQHQQSEDDDEEEEVGEADKEQAQVLNQLSDMSELMQEEIVSIPKEVVLISLVSQEQLLYNPKHQHYRKPQCKDEKWVEIAEVVGWTEAQCKAKWKAMRDQYCRELKRSKLNMKTIVKWKYFKDLDFLRPYALSRNYRPRNSVLDTITSSNNISNNNNTSSNNNLAIINAYNSSNDCNGGATTNNNNNHIKIATPQFQTCNYSVTPAASTTVATSTAASTIRLPLTLPVTQNKSETDGARIMASLTDEQVNSVIQEQHQQAGNWNFLTESAPIVAATTTVATCHNGLATSSVGNASPHDVLYSTFVECVAVSDADQQNQQQEQHHHQPAHSDEEDDDPIHTFLNIDSYFERDLIAMIQQEDILYNSFHPNYRNVKMKLEVWTEIARKLKKTMKQCRLKWKALRDQFIREHKRLKSRENPESLPRWKHYDTLNFLKKFIKQKPCDFDAKNVQMQIAKSEMTDAEMEEHIVDESPLEPSPPATVFELHQQQSSLELHTLPSLTGPHAQEQQQQLQQQAQGNICVSGYDEMDIDSYIIGEGVHDVRDEDVDGNEGDEDVDAEAAVDINEDRKSQQHFPDFMDSIETSNNVQEEQQHQQHQNSNQNMSCTSDGEDGKGDDDGEDDGEDIKGFDVIKAMDETIEVDPEEQEQHIITMDMNVGRVGVTLSTSSTGANMTPPHSDTTQIGGEDSLHQQHILNNQHHQQQHCAQKQMQQQPQSEFHTVAEASHLDDIHNNSNSHLDDAIIANGSPAKGAAAVAITTAPTTSAVTSHDDDEVGAFFRAVAMKIRSAKMSPVAFTDLQIDILRVINGTLRHH